MEKKYLNVKFELKNIIEDDPDNYLFSGYASTFGNVDRGEDIVERGAFIDSLKEGMPKLLWQHEHSEPLGVFTDAYEDEFGLFVKGKMPKADTFVSGRVFPQMKAGSINSMSIGFSIKDSVIEKRDDKVVRLIKKVNLWEVSLVTIPMNPKAVVHNLKSVVPFQDLPLPKDSNGDIDFNMAWDSSEAIKRVREFTGSKESPTSSYKEAFLWYDKSKEDTFSAYKLPIADVVNGDLLVVPRAIFSAAAALRGARGGINIPDGEIDRVISNLNKYYKKMDRPSPFEKSFSDHFESFGHIKDVSDFLKNFGLTNQESNSFISAIKRIARNEQSRRNDQEAHKKLLEMISKTNEYIKEKK